MIDRRLKNREIFEDTIDLINSNKFLTESVRSSVRNQILYREHDDIEIRDKTERTCNTVVSSKRSFEAAIKYAKEGKRVCVLNFASSTNPGGGVVNGSSAQEESLCRCSTLYPCLSTDYMWENFYIPHREMQNPLYNDDCIYTPDVVICKSDISFPERIDEKDWVKVDVITCAAPNLRDKPSNFFNPYAGSKKAVISDDDLLYLHKRRIEMVFKIAAKHGVDVLILGAFGCGAFMNPPKIVANAFRSVQSMYAKYFETIEYAVFCGGEETDNYVAFCKEFGIERNFDLSRFLEAHEKHYVTALNEIKSGHKKSHWMWYIFPQISGLGHSKTSKFYAISDIDEAKAYIKNDVLRAHMIEICEALLKLESDNASDIFGYPDDMKLKSSMTLFEIADSDTGIYKKVLEKFFDLKRDRATLDIIKK